ncbi:MAG: hypothetical protein ABW133_09290 [Polyangiaceae bacterium]
MSAAAPFDVPFEQTWDLTRGSDGLDVMRREVELYRGFCHAACREATTMAAWELAENVSKYGLDDGHGFVGQVTIRLAGAAAFIRTSNGSNAKGSPDDAIAAIDRIASARNLADLYRQRLRELFDDSDHTHTRLGLLRVTYEAGFRLTHRYDASILEIVAQRRCEKSR